MDFFRATVRSARLVLLLTGATVDLLRQRDGSRQARAEWMHRTCRRVLRQMRIPVRVHGRFPDRGSVLSNHTGYLDIPVFGSLHRCVFVSKAEIRSWPVLGFLTTRAGTIYVERGHGGSAARAAEAMRTSSAAALPVVFFPEGTTTDGSTLLPFHSGVLANAVASGEPVTAAYVRYSLGAGNAPGTTVRNNVAYWGKVSLLPHIFRFLSLRRVTVEVIFADGPIRFTPEADRKQMAAEAREAVCALRSSLPGDPVSTQQTAAI